MTQWSTSEEMAERVLAYLHERADEHREVEVSLQRIADDLEVGRMTAQRAVRRLAGTDAIGVSRLGNGALYPTCYRVLRYPKPDVLRRALRLAARTRTAVA